MPVQTEKKASSNTYQSSLPKKKAKKGRQRYESTGARPRSTDERIRWMTVKQRKRKRKIDLDPETIKSRTEFIKRLLRLGSRSDTQTNPSNAMKKESVALQEQIAEIHTGSWRKKTNPHADTNGAPKKGEELQFFQWAEKEWDAYVQTLGEKEQKQIKAAITNMAAKMNA